MTTDTGKSRRAALFDSKSRRLPLEHDRERAGSAGELRAAWWRSFNFCGIEPRTKRRR